MPGSRAWAAVPRQWLRFHKDSKVPPRRFIHCEHHVRGIIPPDRYFAVVGPEGKPGVFKWGQLVRPAEAEILRDIADRKELTKLEMAKDLIRGLLSDGKQEAGWCLKQGTSLGISESTMHEAATLLGVQKVSEGGGLKIKHWWIPPEKWPED